VKFAAVAIAAVLTLAASGLAGARTTSARYVRAYTDETWLSHSLEAHGAYYNRRKIAVDIALCVGLRRYGVHTSTSGLDQFWRFKCDLTGAGRHFYTAQISTTKGPNPSWIYWHFLSVRRNF
jgi:hypothetical protein